MHRIIEDAHIGFQSCNACTKMANYTLLFLHMLPDGFIIHAKYMKAHMPNALCTMILWTSSHLLR